MRPVAGVDAAGRGGARAGIGAGERVAGTPGSGQAPATRAQPKTAAVDAWCRSSVTRLAKALGSGRGLPSVSRDWS